MHPIQTYLFLALTEVATEQKEEGVIAIKGLSFQPRELTVTAGSTVTWVNEDPVRHRIINDPGEGYVEGELFYSEPLAKGERFTHTFLYPGYYTYHCSLHIGTRGTIIVLD
jgi:plastocyanin